VPSKYESLSLVLLESFINNVPVIANGNCQVLLNHIENSEGGWVYFNPKEFNSAILSSLDEIENKKKGNKGYEYVKRNYTWDKVMQKFDHAISLIESQQY
jgi:glycosyltransferase involved in cell wall biosynthesis